MGDCLSEDGWGHITTIENVQYEKINHYCNCYVLMVTSEVPLSEADQEGMLCCIDREMYIESYSDAIIESVSEDQKILFFDMGGANLSLYHLKEELEVCFEIEDLQPLY